MDPKAKPVLVTGATGYVGGRLIPALLRWAEEHDRYAALPSMPATDGVRDAGRALPDLRRGRGIRRGGTGDHQIAAAT